MQSVIAISTKIFLLGFLTGNNKNIKQSTRFYFFPKNEDKISNPVFSPNQEPQEKQQIALSSAITEIFQIPRR